MIVAVVLLLAVTLAAATYWWLERLGSRAWLPFACRSVAWAALGLLLLNVSCPAPPVRPGRPLVLLDASLSLAAGGGRWAEAADSARRWGEVQTFGDERTADDSVPSRGRSLLTPTLTAASVSGREVVIVTDGELEDVADLPRDLLARATVRVFPRHPAADLALTLVEGPSRAAAGDTVAFEIEVRAFGEGTPDTARLTVEAGGKVLARRRLRPAPGGSAQSRITFGTGALGPGEHLLRFALSDAADDEPRDDARVHLLAVTPTPGVVLLANPADWDARFLYRTLKEVAELPVRGYARLEAGRWRSLADLTPVSNEVVRQAARRADLLVAKGAVDQLVRESGARGRWHWASGEQGESVLPGDWYLDAPAISPVAGAFVGLPVDSFPPATQVTPIEPGPGDWVGLTAQEGRRGPARAVMVGRDSAGKRRITLAADGLWRWGFRGGSSEQGYRSWVAATASWLLGGTDTAAGRAHPVRPVVANARPVIFEWSAGGLPQPLGILLENSNGVRRDTLRFDGSGRAVLWLPTGGYRYRLAGGGGGTLAVEEYSDEWLPRPVTLADRSASAQPQEARHHARQWIWLFGVCVLGLAGEWLARRRLGLR